MLTPYQFASNCPISGIDLDGLEFFYAADGTYLGKYGESTTVVLVNDKLVKQISTQQDGVTSYDINRLGKAREAGLSIGLSIGYDLGIDHSDFQTLSATAYAESSVGNGIEIKEEVFALSNAIINFKKASGNTEGMGEFLDDFALASSDGNPQFDKFLNTSAENRNGTFMQTAAAGALNALSGGKDYSNGATHWDGNDIGQSGRKWSEGLKFSESSHDLLQLGNKSVPGKTYWYDKKGNVTGTRGSWDYKWQSTATYSGKSKGGRTSGTTFMKTTDEYKNAGNRGF